jgi:hypothetical protein
VTDETSDTSKADTATGVLDEYEAWLRGVPELRRRLMAAKATVADQRRALDEKEALINAALAQLPVIATPSAESAPVIPIVEEDYSVPQLVLHVLQQAKGGWGSAEIIEAIRSIRPDADPVNIRSAIHRLSKGGEIDSDGERGSMVYSLPRSSQRRTS